MPTTNAVTRQVADRAITFAKIQNLTANRLLGSGAAGTFTTEIVLGTNLSFTGNTLNSTNTGGTVTTISIVTANGFSGSVLNPTTTPSITLTTTISGLLKGDGTAILAAVANTDYLDTTYTGFDTRYLRLTGGTLTGALILNADPIAALGAATKQYVDNLTTGLSWKNAVRLATLTNIALTGAQSIDGIAVVTGDRILVKNQTNQTENGIYIANTAGAWTRSLDADSASELDSATIVIEYGTQANTQWTENLPVTTIDTSNVGFVQISGAGTYTNGTGILLTSNVFSLDVAYTNTLYVPLVRNITINGVVQSLLSDRTFTIITTGTTNRISVTGGATSTPTVDISINYAGQTSITTLGTITTGIWNASPINLSLYASGTLQTAQFPALSGEATTTVGSLSVTLTNSAVIAKVLTGFVAGTGTVSAVDTIFSAIQKLAGNDALYVQSSRFIIREVPTGLVNGNNGTFTIINIPLAGKEEIYVNGFLQDVGTGNDYTISGNTVTFLTGAIPETGDKVRISYIY